MPKSNQTLRGGQSKKPSTPEAKQGAADPKPGSSAGASAPKDAKKGKGPVKDENGAGGKKNGAQEGSAPANGVEPPKKPDTRTLIAGASWTGKLPLALLSELCQKQKWNKPDYSMVGYKRFHLGSH
jgi:ATP-dependent RNA helicase DHX57